MDLSNAWMQPALCSSQHSCVTRSQTFLLETLSAVSAVISSNTSSHCNSSIPVIMNFVSAHTVWKCSAGCLDCGLTCVLIPERSHLHVPSALYIYAALHLGISWQYMQKWSHVGFVTSFFHSPTICVHTRIHMHKKPFSCSVCDCCYARASLLNCRMKCKHKLLEVDGFVCLF